MPVKIKHPKSLFSLFLTLAIPLAYFLNLSLIWRFQQTASFPLPVTILGAVSALTGVILWGMSFWELRSVFQVLPAANKRIKKGVYRWLRHPMYAGILLTFAGLGLTLQSKQGLIFTLLLISPLLIIRALLEEKNFSTNHSPDSLFSPEVRVPPTQKDSKEF